MPSPLSTESIAEQLTPYIRQAVVPTGLYSQLAVYLELILKWNARINLTAIREPREIVRRHFGESLFAGLHVEPPRTSPADPTSHISLCDSLLDLGSGAGFPGIPIQLLRPDLPVTLAESRSRKAAFLSEAVRTMGLQAEVWADRAEAIPVGRRFHTVTLRAVDDMDSAISEASRRAEQRLIIIGTRDAAYPTLPAGFGIAHSIPLPNSRDGVLLILHRSAGSA